MERFSVPNTIEDETQNLNFNVMLEEISRKLDPEQLAEFYRGLNTFLDSLPPESRRCILYYLARGDMNIPESADVYDLEGECSIERYMRDEYKKIINL